MKLTANLKLGTAFGIDILLHWSFFLLPLAVLYLSRSQGDPIHVTGMWLVFLITILASVLWHEMGHALAARHLGIPILDILLTPICGLARLREAPAGPRDEILVALAGPLANCFLTAVFGIAIWLSGGSISVPRDAIHVSLLTAVFWINLSLFVLNLLPVYPKDGGRVLLAILATLMDSGKATVLAARLGQVLSLAAGIAGTIYGIYPLPIIAIFLIVTAEQEIRQNRLYPRSKS